MADPWGCRRGRDAKRTPDQPKQIPFNAPLLLDGRSWSSPEVSNMSTESFILAGSSFALSHVPTEAVLLLLKGGSHIQDAISEDETAFSLLTNKNLR